MARIILRVKHRNDGQVMGRWKKKRERKQAGNQGGNHFPLSLINDDIVTHLNRLHLATPH